MSLSEHEQRQFEKLTSNFTVENPEIAREIKRAEKSAGVAEASPQAVIATAKFFFLIGLAMFVLGFITGKIDMVLSGMHSFSLAFFIWAFSPASYRQGFLSRSSSSGKGPLRAWLSR